MILANIDLQSNNYYLIIVVHLQISHVKLSSKKKILITYTWILTTIWMRKRFWSVDQVDGQLFFFFRAWLDLHFVTNYGQCIDWLGQVITIGPTWKRYLGKNVIFDSIIFLTIIKKNLFDFLGPFIILWTRCRIENKSLGRSLITLRMMYILWSSCELRQS